MAVNKTISAADGNHPAVKSAAQDAKAVQDAVKLQLLIAFQ
jgi:hypothetical protein